jgi:DNA-binding response OmpR family regulator
VLVVEDETLIASSLVRALGSHGFTASSVDNVADAIQSIDGAAPDLVLLDLGLTDGDGTAVATHVARHHPSVPVIVLTARADEVDIVLGLDAGAVDYVIKPFRLAELIARINAHIRMRDAVAEPKSVPGGSTFTTGDLTVDTAARRVQVGGIDVALRPKEFDVLARLIRDCGIVVSREQLIDDVWDENWWGSTKTLDVHINSIRRKLGEHAGDVSRITTVRGVGYRLEREPARL